MTVFTAYLRRGRPSVDRLPAGVLGRLLQRWDARVGVAIVCALTLTALVGPLLVGDPDAPDYANQLAPPGSGHLLGTDGSGRDLLARAVVATRISLGAAVLVTAITSSVGLLVGVLAGCLGGAVDAVVARVVDVLLGLPGLVITLAVVGSLGPGLTNLVLAMSVTGWAALARVARASSRTAMHRPDVRTARMAGVPLGRVALQHVLPGTAAQVAVMATLGVGEVVIALAGLSFLGLGAQPPAAEWGTMLAAARSSLAYAPWQLVGPATGLVLTVLAATLLSEALRDTSDPEDAR